MMQRWFRFAFTASLFILTSSPCLWAESSRTVPVSSLSELQGALDGAVPGDVIEAADGKYTLSDNLKITRSGTKEKPITVRARNRGKAEIAGRGEVLFNQVEHVAMEGFHFTHCARYRGWPWGSITLQDCNNVRFSRNVLHICEDRDFAAPKGIQQWACITGRKSHHNRIDHNLFEGKTLKGDFIAVTGDDYGGECCSRHDRIDHNRFKDFAFGGGENMYETIRAGSNDDGANDVSAFLTIEENLFERCSGEIEMISLKCSDNFILRNTFIDCNGAVTLRLCNRSVVAGNFFFQTANADPKLRCGGVRLYGKDHKIYNNYFENLNGHGMSAPLNVMPGSYDEGDPIPTKGIICMRAGNCEVVFNTWVNCSPLRIGYDSPERPLAPKDCLFANNIIYGGRDGTPLLELFQADGVTFSGNTIFPTGKAETGVSGFMDSAFRIVAAQLVQSGGIWRLASERSPAVGAASGAYGYVTVDVDGQPRDEKPDVGADEYSTKPILRRPLTPKDVGPEAQGQNETKQE